MFDPILVAFFCLPTEMDSSLQVGDQHWYWTSRIVESLASTIILGRLLLLHLASMRQPGKLSLGLFT